MLCIRNFRKLAFLSRRTTLFLLILLFITALSFIIWSIKWTPNLKYVESFLEKQIIIIPPSSQDQQTISKTPNRDLFILIVSSPENRKSRDAIRQTYASNLHGQFKFLIGTKYCHIPDHQRHVVNDGGFTRNIDKICKNCNCRYKKNIPYLDRKVEINDEMEQILKEVKDEQEEFEDIYLLDLVETYQNLTLKMKLGFVSLTEDVEKNKITRPKWVLKVDDDAVVIPRKLTSFLQSKSNREERSENSYIYAGHMDSDKKVLKESPLTNRWGELQYPGIPHVSINRESIEYYYPTYALGATGYVLEYDLVNYISKYNRNLTNYIAEDAAIGIWIDNGIKDNLIDKKINYVSSDKSFSLNGIKHMTKWLCRKLGTKYSEVGVFGHRMDADDIKYCWNKYIQNFARY